MAVKPIPEGYSAVTPYLVVDKANEVLEFMRKAFNAQELFCMRMPDGSVAHAEMLVGDARIMVGGANEKWPAVPGCLYHYVEDCDAVYEAALAAGAESIMEPQDQFYGDRHGGVKDPGGNTWWIATHVEEVSPEELKRRMDEWTEKATADSQA